MRGAFTYQGKRYYVSGKDKTEVEINKALRLKELETKKMVESNMLVRDWADKWLTTYKAGSCTLKTYKDYQTRLNKYILPHIGNMRLKDVKSIHVQGILQGVKHMSNDRINKTYLCINQMFEAAIGNELISSNPAKYVIKPKGYTNTHRAITDDERRIILKVADTHKYGLWVKLMLYCGLRPGETDNVKICHFDYDKKQLYVDGTKTKNAKRVVPVPDEILNQVTALKKQPFDYLFTAANGTKLSEYNRKDMWRSFKKAMHIEMGGKLYRNAIIPPHLVSDDLVPYCLRHTFCTDLQDAGVPINVAKDLMGHADISLTAKIYTHTTDTSINNAAKLMENFRRNNKGKEEKEL